MALSAHFPPDLAEVVGLGLASARVSVAVGDLVRALATAAVSGETPIALVAV